MPRSFDNLAASYCFLEHLMFGGKLESARIMGLKAINPAKPQRALILGEGDGRFSFEALKAFPLLSIDSIEKSPRMREQTQKRLDRFAEDDSKRHRFIANDARACTFPISEYDIVFTHFFLDCFHSSDANALLSKIARTLKSQGRLVYTDFSISRHSPAKFFQTILVSFLYLSFRLSTDIESKQLPSLAWPESLKLTSRSASLSGLITSEIRTRV